MSLAIHTPLPLNWLPDAAPGAESDAVTLLRALSMLDGLPTRRADEQDERWRELEARVDLCLLMLGRLLARDGGVPAARSLSLSGQRVVWLADAAPAPGARGTVALYLSQALPLPLTLAARVIEAPPAEDGRYRVEAELLIESAELQDWLDKTVFRHHRRDISQRKKYADDAA